ncbi:MAG: PilZ domain-containing protein [Myxococcota bacterium]|jgi:hypothetical protein|nr:PilZ domain-containing protein [Myxococcota bacterium]
MGSIEQRRATRFNIELSSELYTKRGVVQANTRNLSSNGLCLDTKEQLDEGGVVGVSLFLTNDGIEDPDREPLNLKARVIWCTEREDQGFSSGARFDELTKEQETLLNQYLVALGG